MSKEIDEKELELIERKTKIDNLVFNKRLHTFLAGSYTLMTFGEIQEFVANDFNVSGIYVPIILGSIGVVIYSINTLKKNRCKLSNERNKYALLEQELVLLSEENTKFRK